MKITHVSIPDVKVFSPDVFEDERGCFYESYNQNKFSELIGTSVTFVQDNHSVSKKNVVRGLHYQISKSQGKLVRVIKGSIFDVAVDLRRSSSFFGKYVALQITATGKEQIYIPAGFAHGFMVLSDVAEVIYKTTDFWSPKDERCLLWNDRDLNINWPVVEPVIVSQKDLKGQKLKEAETFT